MAVAAADLAFLELESDLSPHSCAPNERRHIEDLVAQMIEVQHERIGFAAVDTRMYIQVLADSLDERDPTSAAIAENSSAIGRPRREVPGVGDLALTRSADAMMRAVGLGAKRKIGDGLGTPADAADTSGDVVESQLFRF